MDILFIFTLHFPLSGSLLLASCTEPGKSTCLGLCFINEHCVEESLFDSGALVVHWTNKLNLKIQG